MVVYIDADYRVHTESGDGRETVETTVFDGMPEPVIDCHRYVPGGRQWVRPDGVMIYGEFVQMCVSKQELDAAQRAFERQQLADMAAELADALAALAILGVSADE